MSDNNDEGARKLYAFRQAGLAMRQALDKARVSGLAFRLSAAITAAEEAGSKDAAEAARAQLREIERLLRTAGHSTIADLIAGGEDYAAEEQLHALGGTENPRKFVEL